MHVRILPILRNGSAPPEDLGNSPKLVGFRRRLTFNPNPSGKRSIPIPDTSVISAIFTRRSIFAARVLAGDGGVAGAAAAGGADKSLTIAEVQELAHISERTVKSAQIFIGALPILVVYPYLQRYFVKGVVLGSLKG